jgi:hypothetical protein
MIKRRVVKSATYTSLRKIYDMMPEIIGLGLPALTC